jgi:hypothetical protein
MRRLGALVLSISGLIVVSGSGCAFVDRHVRLTTYPPPAPRTDPGAAYAAARAGVPLVEIVVNPFTDERDKPVVGEVRNGFGMHTADVIADGSVRDWVTSAVIYELRAAGFRARSAAEGPPTPDDIVVSGTVLTFYCRAMMEYEADVSFLVQVNSGGQVVFNGRAAGTGSAGVNWAASDEGYAESLAGALQQAARTLVVRVRPALTRPRVPAPPAPAPAPPATS